MRSFFVIILSLLSIATASADERSQAVLRGVAEYVRALGSYDATFTVEAGDYQTLGQYSVAGDNYHIVVDQAEVYADGKVRTYKLERAGSCRRIISFLYTVHRWEAKLFQHLMTQAQQLDEESAKKE
jgi:hypothetical protein